jgi:hypothetical protein
MISRKVPRPINRRHLGWLLAGTRNVETRTSAAAWILQQQIPHLKLGGRLCLRILKHCLNEASSWLSQTRTMDSSRGELRLRRMLMNPASLSYGLFAEVLNEFQRRNSRAIVHANTVPRDHRLAQRSREPGCSRSSGKDSAGIIRLGQACRTLLCEEVWRRIRLVHESPEGLCRAERRPC